MFDVNIPKAQFEDTKCGINDPIYDMDSEQHLSVKQLSHEQKIVIAAIVQKNNVVVDSIAGSGKTTTIIACANKIPNSSVLLLTFNAKLKEEC